MSNLSCPHSARLLSSTVLLVALVACGPSTKKNSATDSTGILNGSVVEVFLDPNDAGDSTNLTLEEVQWGRLVDVFDEAVDSQGNPGVRTLQRRDFIINDQRMGDGVFYRLKTNQISQRQELTIIADADETVELAPNGPSGSNAQTHADWFVKLFDDLRNEVPTLTISGTDTSQVDPVDMIPRNAALSLRFSDLLDASSINSSTVRMSVGVPPLFPTEARVFADQNHGAFLDGVFHPTRVIVDTTISEFDASDGVLAVNSVGLPPGVASLVASGALRIPTSVSLGVGQFEVLRNRTFHSVAFTNNGPTESNTTLDVVRSFRAGRETDPNNGFLFDSEPPTVRGVQVVAFQGTPRSVAPDANLGEVAEGNDKDRVFEITFDFATLTCAHLPKVGDILTITGTNIPQVIVEVTKDAIFLVGSVVTDVRVRLIRFPVSETLDALEVELNAATSAVFESSFINGGVVSGECFLSISPPPGQAPTTDISTSPRINLRFSEAIDPDSIRPYDNFRLARVSGTTTPNDIVVGLVTNTPDLREFRYSPTLPLNFDPADPDSGDYFFNLVGGLAGVTDLAGNPLVDTLPANIPLNVADTATDSLTGGLVLRFDAFSEFGLTIVGEDDVTTLPLPEVRGQFLRDLSRGVIKPRVVQRLSQVIDLNTNVNFYLDVGGVPTVLPGSPLTTPMSRDGSRLQTVWRHADVGFEILDEDTANIDVECISWAPTETTVKSDLFAQFEMSLSHSSRLPDVLAPLDAGLRTTFDSNPLVDPVNLSKVVHPRESGYVVNPLDQFTSVTDTEMMPFPLNRTGNASNFTYFTWRDTAVIGVGGADGLGAELQDHLARAAFVGLPSTVSLPCLDASNDVEGEIYTTGMVRSLALPLLMEFKCFTGPGAKGLNTLSTVIMAGASPFRSYSTGGASGAVNPDAETTAVGDQTTGMPGTDTEAYIGQLDLVVRISRVHTRWFDTGVVSNTFPIYGAPVIEPRLSEQPNGTNVTLAYRGAVTITDTTLPDPGLNPDMNPDMHNANLYDAYGDPLNITLLDDNMGTCTDSGDDTFGVAAGAPLVISAGFEPAFLNGDGTWKSDISEVNGARFIQVRITFTSNAATGQTPELSTLALPYVRG
ncbi:MAG: hypothetical protein ACI8TQ_000672 [Planctomycetota bacterium]|jgi:hypothetical protein